MEMELVLEWTVRLISLAVLLQGCEMLMIQKSWHDGGIWSWPILKKDFSESPKIIQKLCDLLLGQKGFLIIVCTQIVFSFLNLFAPHFLVTGILFVTAVLVAVRWRGTFNGGSDYMTALILLSLFFAGLFSGSPKVQYAFIAYIAVQTVFSYTLAGFVKLKEKPWRSGVALTQLLNNTNYIVPFEIKSLTKNSKVAFLIGWSVLIYECTFPLTLLNPTICFIYITLGMVFHLANFYVLGLNRFFFAWLAAYPALYFLSTNLNWF